MNQSQRMAPVGTDKELSDLLDFSMVSDPTHPSSPPTPHQKPKLLTTQSAWPALAWLPPETEGESRSHEGHVTLSSAAQTPINCKCFGAQNPNNPQCFWENELVASRGRSAPLPDEAHMKGPQPSLSTQPKTSPVLGPGAESSAMGLNGLPWAVSGPGVT